MRFFIYKFLFLFVILNLALIPFTAAAEKNQSYSEMAYGAAQKLKATADAKAKEAYNSVSNKASAIKQGLESTGTKANKALKDAADAAGSLVNEAGNKASYVIQQAKDTVSAPIKAVDVKNMDTAASLYVRGMIYGTAENMAQGTALTEKLKNGDTQGAKQLAIELAEKTAVGSVIDTNIQDQITREIQFSMGSTNALNQMQSNIKMQMDMAFEKAMKDAKAETAKDVSKMVPEQNTEKIKALEEKCTQMVCNELSKNPGILTNDTAIREAAKVYYEAARAYVEKLYNVKVPAASQIYEFSFTQSKKDKEDTAKSNRDFYRTMKRSAPRPAPCPRMRR